MADIDVPLDATSQEFGLEVLWVGWVEIWRLRDVAAARSYRDGASTARLKPLVISKVECLVDTIDLNLDRVKAAAVLRQVEHVLVLFEVESLGAGEECCDDGRLHCDLQNNFINKSI